jgi:phosphatidylglycerophosphate synthase
LPIGFRVIFANPAPFTKISLDTTVLQGEVIDLASTKEAEISSTLQQGFISTDITICRHADLANLAFDTYAELIQCWRETQALCIGFIANAWWLKVTGQETSEQLKAFFWKIAFKEISGEFSKLVNSKLSKPVTFLFVDLGFSPNAISILELVLFLFASVFLLFPYYWTMILFAIIWQFSAGVLDRCDGEVARIRNYESDAGGRFDMLIDDLRFALPFLFLTVACYREYASPLSYLLAAMVTTLWYGTAVVRHSQFLRRSGYVSIQTMGQDFFKNRQGAWVKSIDAFNPLSKVTYVPSTSLS